MANTYTLIASNTLTTTAASVTFSAIPATYDDLHIVWSARSSQNNATTRIYIRLNGTSGTSYSWTKVDATGTSAGSARLSNGSEWRGEYVSANNATSNTYGSGEIYLPKYTSSTSKPASGFGVAENNTTVNADWFIVAMANLTSISSAITQIDFSLATADFMSGSSFYIYGIKNT